MNLYESLKANIDDNLEINISSLVSFINNLEKEHKEMIFVLIVHHAKINGEKIRKKTLPYSCSLITNKNKGVMINFNKLPEELIKIINQYVLLITT